MRAMNIGDLSCEMVWIIMRGRVPGVCAPGLSEVNTAEAYQMIVFGLTLVALTVAAVVVKIRIDKRAKNESA